MGRKVRGGVGAKTAGCWTIGGILGAIEEAMLGGPTAGCWTGGGILGDVVEAMLGGPTAGVRIGEFVGGP